MTLTTCRFDYIINHLNRKGIKKMKAVITVTGRDSDGIKIPFGEFVDKMRDLGDSAGLQISAMHEDIFNTMHHI